MKSQINTMILIGEKQIPVGIGSVVATSNEISFKTLHDCGNPIKKTPGENGKTPPGKNGVAVTAIQQKTFCPTCDVDVEEPVKGFEYAKNQYVILTDEEIDSIAPDGPKEITINKFVPRNQVTGLMVDKHHFLIPNDLVPGGYAALYGCLAAAKLVGVGTQNLWGKERPCAIYPEAGFEGHAVLALMILHNVEDLVMPDFTAEIATKDRRVEMAVVVKSMMGELTGEDLASAQRARLNTLIRAKIDLIENPPKPDLVEALKPRRRKAKVA